MNVKKATKLAKPDSLGIKSCGNTNLHISIIFNAITLIHFTTENPKHLYLRTNHIERKPFQSQTQTKTVLENNFGTCLPKSIFRKLI